MVDNFLIQCEFEETVEEIFYLIGTVLQLEDEDELSFQYLGLCVDFNDVDIKESNTHIMIICYNHSSSLSQKQGFPILSVRRWSKNTAYLVLIVHEVYLRQGAK